MKNCINLTTRNGATVSLPISKIQRIGSNQHGGIVDIGRSFGQEDKVLDVLTNVEISP